MDPRPIVPKRTQSRAWAGNPLTRKGFGLGGGMVKGAGVETVDGAGVPQEDIHVSTLPVGRIVIDTLRTSHETTIRQL